jgi:LysR family glycine cleavage system transcriptional activator
LTAFEAAARLGSFRLAAAELGITRSAVSHQVKSLEQRLGVQLFRRDARRAELTQAGHTYFPPVRDAFDMVEAQTRALKPSAADNELTGAGLCDRGAEVADLAAPMISRSASRT